MVVGTSVASTTLVPVRHQKPGMVLNTLQYGIIVPEIPRDIIFMPAPGSLPGTADPDAEEIVPLACQLGLAVAAFQGHLRQGD